MGYHLKRGKTCSNLTREGFSDRLLLAECDLLKLIARTPPVQHKVPGPRASKYKALVSILLLEVCSWPLAATEEKRLTEIGPLSHRHMTITGQRTCYLCGSPRDLTRDHVPPRDIFPSPCQTILSPLMPASPA